jgi:hypothetical protein
MRRGSGPLRSNFSVGKFRNGVFSRPVVRWSKSPIARVRPTPHGFASSPVPDRAGEIGGQSAFGKRTGSRPRRFQAGEIGEAAERPGQARMSCSGVPFRPWPERSARSLSLWPARAGLVQPFAPIRACPPRDGPGPKAASHADSGGPGTNLRTGGGFGFPPMDRFTSPVLTLSTPARTFVRPVAPHNRPHRTSGRQLDALPRDGTRSIMRPV